ncbi:sigma-70 family RNA polymerase sigma factor [Mycolicibacterium parafortuitum]|nr:sigma-70 family RNA polymerase sigma factor [Mycolicibacterium parafortuitum]ORB28707.1 RNA polymerase subunit sigma [Mycolicibacterium parafortuitum]
MTTTTPKCAAPQREQRADDTEFERAALSLAPMLKRRAYGYTGNAADAEDLVQETLLKAYRAFPRLGPDPYLKAWLLSILRNTWIAKYRAAQCRPAETLTAEFQDGDTGAVSAEELVLRDIADDRLVAALAELSEPMRLTVYYTAVEGMSCREVARVMGVPEGTVMSRMHRGRAQLRRRLSQPGTRPAPRKKSPMPARRP